MCFESDSGLKNFLAHIFGFFFEDELKTSYVTKVACFSFFCQPCETLLGLLLKLHSSFFCGRCLFSRVILISRKIISGMNFACNWTNSHMMAYWSKITVLFAGPQEHQGSFFMLLKICCFLFSNLLFLNVDNSQLSEMGKCLFCFGEFLQVQLKFNFFIDFFQSGIKKSPKKFFCIFECEIKKNCELAGPIFSMFCPQIRFCADF